MKFDLRRVLAFGVLLLALGTMSGCLDGVGVGSNSELEKAKKLIGEGHYEAALMRLNQILAESPKDPEVHLNLAWLYLYTNDPEHAKLELRRVEELAPGSAEIYHLRGALLSYDAQHDPENDQKAQEQLELAVANFKKALSKNPRNSQTYFDLAIALNALNRSQEALVVLNKGFDYIPKSDLETQVNFQIASCSAYINLGQFEEAIADCNQAAEFTENPASKQRIADLIENMRLLNPKERAENAEAQPTPEQIQEAKEKNSIQTAGGTD